MDTTMDPEGHDEDLDGTDAELPPWMHADDDWDAADRRPRAGRARLIALAAAVPWLLALVMVVRSGGDPAEPAGEAVSPAPTAEVPAATTATATPPGEEARSALDDGAPPPITFANRPRTAVTGADAVAMATAVARAWITGVGPTFPVEGVDEPPALYAEHLVAEAIDHPAPGLAVVTLLGVVLDVDGGAYTGASVRRLAVPLALDAAGAHPAGSPWWLPSPDLAPAEIERISLDDPDVELAAVEAVQAAGYRDVELLHLSVTDSWPLIATLRAIAPGRTEPREHELWLRPHLDGLVVAGWLPERIEPTEDRP